MNSISENENIKNIKLNNIKINYPLYKQASEVYRKHKELMEKLKDN